MGEKYCQNWISICTILFYKTNYIEVERGVEYMNYQRKVAILIDY